MSESTYQQIHPIHDGKECRDTFDNYNLWIREFFVNGILDGLRTVYYPLTGQIKISESYRDGKREGERKSWYENGQLREMEFYHDGKPEGKFQSWNFDGSDCGEAFYENGKLNGISKCRYENGKLRSMIHYRDGMEIKYTAWNARGYPSYVSYSQYDECGCHQREISWYLDGFRHQSNFRWSSKLNGEYKKWNRWGGLEIHEYHQDGELIHNTNFASKRKIYLKLKIKIYIRDKKVILSSFLISDLTMSVIDMIRI